LCIVSDRPGEVKPGRQINFFSQLFTTDRFSGIIFFVAAERWGIKFPLWVFVFLAIGLRSNPILPGGFEIKGLYKGVEVRHYSVPIRSLYPFTVGTSFTVCRNLS
jgi:hypothetical protein